MNTLEMMSPRNATGTCSAKIINDPDITDFQAAAFTVMRDEVNRRWMIYAQAASSHITSGLRFFIPLSGNVKNKKYKLVTSPDNDSEMTIIWEKLRGGELFQYISTHGRAKVTIDEKSRKTSVEFEFIAGDGNTTVEVSHGQLKVTGYSHDIGSVTGDVRGAINTQYKSTEVSLTHQPASRTFPASFLGWSRHYQPRPDVREFIMALRVADNLRPGTYQVSTQSQEVEIVLFDMNRRFVPYWGYEGEVNIIAIPTPGTTKGGMKATFHFKGADGTKRETVEVSDGHLDIRP